MSVNTEALDNKEQLNNNKPIVKFIWIFIPFGLSFFMSVLLRTINSVLSPTLIETFDMNASQLGTMTSAYFISFAIAQIPLGVALDRWGPGKTLGVFMLFGVAGCMVYGLAPTVTFLFVGRALVGFGVSGCLMASYKAIGDWRSMETVPMYNGFITFIGGVGGIFATKPVSIATDFISWRILFFVFAGMMLVVAILVFFTKTHPKYKEYRELDGEKSVLHELKGTAKIAVTARFWRFAPAAVLTQATYISLNGLWIGPWLKDVGGHSPDNVVNYLLICSISITLGYICYGTITSWLKKRFQIKVIKIFVVTMWVFVALTAIIALAPQMGAGLWVMFLLICPFCLVAYPIFVSMFDTKLAGRVQTLFNMIVFIASTFIQSGIGVIIDQYPLMEDGGFNPQGYSTAILILAALNAASLIWCMLYRRKKNEIQY